MDILIHDNWLRDILKTSATTKEIAKYLSLCGPSVEKINQIKNRLVYSIEVTTNRVDSASIYGIAREAAAILPRFGIKTRLAPLQFLTRNVLARKVDYLAAQVDHKLCPRFTAVLIRNVKIKDSPDWLRQRLEAVDVRPINNIVDISNYLMHELGQPVHTFDYDKIKGAKMILRPSRPGEKLTTLDGKSHRLEGGDIVIEDGEGKLIDLAGIMGGLNSAVDGQTKNVLLFVQTYSPAQIRKTSMALAQRTEAAMLFEKDLDPELVKPAILRGIELFEKLTQVQAEKQILDLYPNPYRGKKVVCDLDLIRQKLGVSLPRAEIRKILNSLGFETQGKGKNLEVEVPSFRAKDITIPEDIIEEIARIYGYHKLPSRLMTGVIPDPLPDAPFDFEQKLKNLLKGYGAIEVYTLSLVARDQTAPNSLRIINPLGGDTEYLRTSLLFSLNQAARENAGEKEPFHLFEMANLYLPLKGSLPEEKMTLAGIFANCDFRLAKGVIEMLLEELNIKADFIPEDSRYFLPSQRLVIKTGGKYLGQFGVLEEGCFPYYEFSVEALRKASRAPAYQAVPQKPPQIEDLTLTFPPKTRVGDVVRLISSIESLVSRVELTDIYKESYTFRLWYQHPTKTLTDTDVTAIRTKILTAIKQKFGGMVK